ncbi:hypothetical protein M0802_007273 [Mischocyttarus mexicanus]|nr:hypothetical protein M0802_007273 [Mischocyttarus mexicanus]
MDLDERLLRDGKAGSLLFEVMSCRVILSILVEKGMKWEELEEDDGMVVVREVLEENTTLPISTAVMSMT